MVANPFSHGEVKWTLYICSNNIHLFRYGRKGGESQCCQILPRQICHILHMHLLAAL